MSFFSRAFSIFRKEGGATTPAVRSNQSVGSAVPGPVAAEPTTHGFYRKEELVSNLIKIKEQGWVENTKRGNDGAVGLVLEELLGIPNNNVAMPDATEWELKAQRANTSSLISLSHSEPHPRPERIVTRILLPKYGWPHEQAGTELPAGEQSFRQTMNGQTFTDRGFKVCVNRELRRVEVLFDSSSVSQRHSDWLKEVEERVGLGPLPVTPYWTFNDVYLLVGRKFYNCIYVKADVKQEDGKEYFFYKEAYFLKSVNLDHFLDAIESGAVKVEFNARSGHNHGTRFRVPAKNIPDIYSEVERIF